MFYTYILRCSDGSFYIGHSNDPDSRERRHNEGRGGAYTLQRRPVKLVYVESFGTLSEAIGRERQLKRWTRKKKEALIDGDMARLKRL